MAQIEKHAVIGVRKFLIANKVDEREKRVVTTEEGQKIAKMNGMMYFEVSAKNNIEVKSCIDFAVKDVIDQKIMNRACSDDDIKAVVTVVLSSKSERVLS